MAVAVVGAVAEVMAGAVIVAVVVIVIYCSRYIILLC